MKVICYRSWRVCRALIGFVMAVQPPCLSVRAEEPKWNCAVYAAYAARIQTRPDEQRSSAAEIAMCFPAPYREADVDVPLSVLVNALRSADLDGKAVQFASDRVKELTAPAILLIYPLGKDRSERIGHYVFVQEVTDTDVALIDADSLGAEFHVPFAQLSEIWDGHAIIFQNSKTRIFEFLITWSLPTIAALILATRVFAKPRHGAVIRTSGSGIK